MVSYKTRFKLLVMIMTVLSFGFNPALSFSDIESIQKLTADGKLAEALKLTNDELAKDKTNVTYRFLRGLILTRMDRLEEARDVFIEITTTNPDLPEPYNNLAVIYASLGDYDKARELLEQAINTHPAYATAHENIGDIYAKLASQAYNQALELDRENNMARAKLSLVNNLFSLPESVKPDVIAGSAPAAEVPAVTPVTVVEPAPVAVTKNPPAAVVQQKQPEPAVTRNEAVAPQTAGQNQERQISVALIKQTVLDWAAAWSRQDVDGYLSYYAGDFSTGDNRSPEQWRQYRRERLTAPQRIEVLVSDLVVDMLGADHAQATFTQIYNSPGYSDRVKKNLLLKQEQNNWRITQEQTK